MNKFNKVLPVFQGEVSECGLACIVMLLNYLGINEDLPGIRVKYKLSDQGLTMAELVNIAADYKVNTLPIKFETESLLNIPLPAILHVNGNHYVLAVRTSGSIIHIIDPGMGEQFLHQALLSANTTGFAVILNGYDNERTIRDENNKKQVQNLYSFRPKLSLTLLAAGLVGFAVPVFIGNVINGIVDKTSFNIYWKLGAAYLAAILLVFLLDRISAGIIINKAQFSTNEKMKTVFYRFIHKPVSYFNKRQVGDMIERIISFNHSLLAVEQIRYTVFNSIIICCISFVAMVWLHPLLALISAVSIAIIGILTHFFIKKISGYKQEIEKNHSEQQQYYNETISGIVSWKSSGNINNLFLQFTDNQSRYLKNWKAKAILEVNQSALYAFIGSFELLLMLGIALNAITNNELTLGAFYAFIFVRQIAFSALTTINKSITEMNVNAVVFKRAVDLYDSDVQNRARIINNDFEMLSVKNLSYGFYNKELIINDVSFSIGKGEKISIMGESGSGKTSMLFILAGLNTPIEAEFKIDDVTLSSDQLMDLSYLQTPFDILLKGSIIDNITMYQENPDRKKCLALLTDVGLNDKINSLPDGVDSFVTDCTSTFSAGERQRLIVCRALYSDKSIILFDEPTANLDEKNAEMIFKAIMKSPKACVVVTHDDKFKSYFHRNYMLASKKIYQGG